MWKTLLTSLNGLIGGFSTYLIVIAVSLAVGGYFGYDLTANHYIAKIALGNLKAMEEKDAIQRKGDELVAQYVKRNEELSANLTSIQRQIPMALHANSAGTCSVPNGFVRLFNASGTGSPTAPESIDGATSTVDLATVLSVVAENNEKYNKIAEQLKELQAFENAK